jgi:excisionase family DNA binding protein
MPDTSAFKSRAEAARILGVSEKSIQRYVAKKQLKQYSRQRPGLQTITVYDPAELDRLQAQIKTANAEPTAPPSVPLDKKSWLTLREAAALSGLSTAFLKRSIDAGDLPALRDGRRWKINRFLLQCWRPSGFEIPQPLRLLPAAETIVRPVLSSLE